MTNTLWIDEFKDSKDEIEEDTGFVCYESMPGDQLVFYGTSDKLDEFKTAIGTNAPTGSIAMAMDTGKKYMYSALKDAWYEL